MTVAIFLIILLSTVALGVPIAFALLLCSLGLMLHLDMLDPQIMAQCIVNGADNFTLLAIPFFVFAGEIMNVGGLAKRLIELQVNYPRPKGHGLVAAQLNKTEIPSSLFSSRHCCLKVTLHYQSSTKLCFTLSRWSALGWLAHPLATRYTLSQVH